VRRSLTIPTVVAALMLPACSGGTDDTVATTAASSTAATAVAPTTLAPTTVAPSAAPLFGSLGGFVAAYTAVGGSGATQGTEFALTEDGLTTGTIDSELGDTGFISVEAIPSGVIGGATSADGAVTSVFVFVDPLTASAAPAVLSLIGSMVATPARFDEAGFAQEYRSLAIEASVRADDQIWYPSTNGSGHSVVVSVVQGAAGSNNLIEVAIVPIVDEAAAKAAVKPLRNAVFSLVA
jgi:hypothetical protein